MIIFSNFLLITSIALSQSVSIYNEVARFCDKNGMRFLTITSFEGNTDNAISKILEATKNLNIRSRSISNSKLNSSMQFHLDDFLAISNGPESTTEFDTALESIKLRKIKKSLLLITGQVDENQLMTKLQELQGNAFFYLIYPGSTKTNFKQIISLSHTQHTIVSDIKLNQFGFIMEDYNLQGINIVSYTLSWAPFFVLEDCNDFGQKCKSSGFLADYMDALGAKLNFTWVSYKDPENIWGVTPIDGIYNKSGKWHGVLGSIVKDKYHLSLSQWLWTSERHGLLDFVSTSTDFTILVFTPSPPEVDMGLFIRPFRNDAWGGFVVVIAICLIVLVVPYAYLNFYEITDGYMITSTSIWFFFLLVNAYYGGALTMFFTTEVSVPFETMEDVMRAYPDYNLMMQAGNEFYFYRKAEYDPLYADFWTRVQDSPDETVYDGINEGLKLIQNGRNILHLTFGRLVGYFKTNPFIAQKIKVFGKGKAQYYSYILPFNSPLKPILQKGTNALIETGALDHLLKTWVGTGVPINKDSEKMVLSSGQVFLVFGILLLTIGSVCIILIFEVLRKKLTSS